MSAWSMVCRWYESSVNLGFIYFTLWYQRNWETTHMFSNTLFRLFSIHFSKDEPLSWSRGCQVDCSLHWVFWPWTTTLTGQVTASLLNGSIHCARATRDFLLLLLTSPWPLCPNIVIRFLCDWAGNLPPPAFHCPHPPGPSFLPTVQDKLLVLGLLLL